MATVLFLAAANVHIAVVVAHLVSPTTERHLLWTAIVTAGVVATTAAYDGSPLDAAGWVMIGFLHAGTLARAYAPELHERLR